MPALAKPPVRLPRFVPHFHHGATAEAGFFSTPEAIVPTPDFAPGQSSELDHLAHDARNVLTGLMLYCELLSAPGVLTKQHRHYAQDLEAIAKSATHIFERMAAAPAAAIQGSAIQSSTIPASQALPTAPVVSVPTIPAPAIPVPAATVTDAAAELRHLQPLLAAIAGSAIKLSIATMPCAGRTALAVEDFTRILVNLVRNAADAMAAGGHIRITAQYGDGFSFLDADEYAAFASPHSVLITVADNGPGIPDAIREQIFDLGFTTRRETGGWPTPRRRGLGLSIVRNLVEARGGTVRATSMLRGARFEITLPLYEPVTSDTCSTPPNSAFPADSHAKGCIECR